MSVETKNIRIDLLERENQVLREENDSLKRENFAYYNTLYTPTSDETYVDNEKEPINLLEQSNIDYEKEIKHLKQIIKLLLD